MQVNNRYLTNTPVAKPEGKGPAEVARRPEGDEPAAAPGQSTHTPSAELVRLLSAARQEPEVRADRVREVSEKLANGFYLTDEAAAQTAGAILE